MNTHFLIEELRIVYKTIFQKEPTNEDMYHFLYSSSMRTHLAKILLEKPKSTVEKMGYSDFIDDIKDMVKLIYPGQESHYPDIYAYHWNYLPALNSIDSCGNLRKGKESYPLAKEHQPHL